MKKPREWALIEGYRFPYRINDLGEVQRQMPDGSWRPVKAWVSRGGGGSAGRYLFVKLAVNPAGHRRIPVVRLMEGRWIRPKRPGELVSYRNGFVQDCSKYNLYYTSREAINMKVGGALRRSVEKIDPSGNVLELYRSVEEAAEKNFLSKGCVTRRCLGRVKNPFRLTGFSFRYERRRHDGHGR